MQAQGKQHDKETDVKKAGLLAAQATLRPFFEVFVLENEHARPFARLFFFFRRGRETPIKTMIK